MCEEKKDMINQVNVFHCQRQKKGQVETVSDWKVSCCAIMEMRKKKEYLFTLGYDISLSYQYNIHMKKEGVGD